MPDSTVGALPRALNITPTDLFVLEQLGNAKSLPGQVLIDFLVKTADGHGGIHDIKKIDSTGLVDTYRITLADKTTSSFRVTNGRGITDIAKTETVGYVDTYTIYLNDGSTKTFTVKNGEKGDKGDTANLWLKFAAQKPSDLYPTMGDIPDDWVGICPGHMDSAPDSWSQYKWYKWRGETGRTGDPAEVLSNEVRYQIGDSGSIIPSGNWQAAVPVVPQGKYMWMRATVTFNTGTPLQLYLVSRYGLDGKGSVGMVAGVSPGPDGNVPLTPEHIHALPTAGGDMTGEIRMNGQPISGLNPPQTDTEPVTKADGDSRYLQLSGGTMNGPLTVMQPTASGHAARKQDVDNAVKTAKTYTDGKITWLSATLPTAWTGSGPYTQTVSVPGIPAEAKAVTCWPEWAADAATRAKQREAWNALSRIVPSAGNIDFTCDEEKPTTAVPMRIEVQT